MHIKWNIQIRLYIIKGVYNLFERISVPTIII